MSACFSRLALSRWEVSPESERPAVVRDHVASCPRCSRLLADISESRSLLLGTDPEEAGLRAAKSILAAVAANRAKKRWRWPLLVPAFLLPAVAAAVFFVQVTTAPGPGTFAVKGAFIVEAYCKRGEDIFPVVDGADFVEGDRLRFAYTKDRPGHLVVFSVDDQGQISPYYQDRGLFPMSIESGAKVMLPGSIELDDHKGWERVYALWSSSPLAELAIRQAVQTAFAAANGDLHQLTVLDLPGEQVSFLLRRP